MKYKLYTRYIYLVNTCYMTLQFTYTGYIPGIYLEHTWHINGLHLVYSFKTVYTCLIQGIWLFKKVYTWYILGIYQTYDHLVHIPGLYLEKTLWVCSVPVTYPGSHVIYQRYIKLHISSNIQHIKLHISSNIRYILCHILHILHVPCHI